MDSYIYELVKTNQKTLSAKEQFAKAVSVRQSCDKILEYCYLHPQAKAIILGTLAQTVNRSKLGRDYNAAILGLNKSIHDRITNAYNEVLMKFDIDGARILRQANLHPRIVLNDEVMRVINARPTWQGARVQEELAVLNESRTALVNCVLEAAAGIAITKHKQLNNEVIEESDLFQEAFKAAYEGTLIYNYDSKAKWSSFAYSRMYDVVSNFIADKSRVVSIPRSMIERFNLVVKAVSVTQSIDTLTLMNYSNAHLERGLEYTEKEVETILLNMQGTISLDSAIDEEDEGNQSNSLLDLLTIDDKAEEELKKIFMKRNIASILKKRLSPLEYEIIDSMWGLTGDPKDLLETYNHVNEVFPTKNISKNRVKRISEKVLLRLKKNNDLKDIWQEI